MQHLYNALLRIERKKFGVDYEQRMHSIFVDILHRLQGGLQ